MTIRKRERVSLNIQWSASFMLVSSRSIEKKSPEIDVEIEFSDGRKMFARGLNCFLSLSVSPLETINTNFSHVSISGWEQHSKLLGCPASDFDLLLFAESESMERGGCLSTEWSIIKQTNKWEWTSAKRFLVHRSRKANRRRGGEQAFQSSSGLMCWIFIECLQLASAEQVRSENINNWADQDRSEHNSLDCWLLISNVSRPRLDMNCCCVWSR